MDSAKIARLLMQTWPAKMAQDAWNAIKLPGDVYKGNIQAGSPEYYDRANSLAGVMVGFPGTPGGAIGSGMRRLPLDNYLKPLKEYTPSLYREMSPTSALETLPGSNVYAGYGPGGPQRLFYSDVPELALGQGTNKGVRVHYNSDAFEGQIHKKPMWEPMFESGQAEYVAAPMKGVNLRDHVNDFTIDRSALKGADAVTRAQYSRLTNQLKEAGWGVTDENGVMTFTRPKP